jgi:5S rRNA maturation endonuclease (ribonuclease M5)
VVAGQPVYLCEGEKDADAMRRAFGVCATTNPFGALAWARDSARHGYANHLRGADVIVVQDRDAAGMKRTAQIATSLAGVAASLHVLQAAAGKDAADHIAAGLRIDQLVPAIPMAPDADDGSFAALPRAFLERVKLCGLSHLQYRILNEIAWHSVRREHQKAVWQALPCPSTWLARCCGGASPQQVRRAIALLRDANILIDERPEGVRGHAAAILRIQGDFAQWHAVNLSSSDRAADLHSARTPPASCEDTSTREDLGLRERESWEKGLTVNRRESKDGRSAS